MKDVLFTVESVKFLNEDIFELMLAAKEPLPSMCAGQFVHLKLDDGGMLLRRPFCLYKFDKHTVTLIVAVVGDGTKKLSGLQKGASVYGIIPLGNGFTLSEKHQKIALIGGGVGCAPLLMVPETFKNREYRSYLGFANKNRVLFETDFKKVSYTTVSIDDGSYGYKGYVSNAFLEDYKNGYRPDVILTCGPEPMIKAVAKISLETKIPAYMSGETRMGCGVGACLVCACAVRENGEIRNKRACADGPVFLLEDLVL